MIRRGLALAHGTTLGTSALEFSAPQSVWGSKTTAIDASTTASINMVPKLGQTLQAVEREVLEATLHATGGNRTRAAEMMGVSLRTIRNKIREYGLPAREAV